MISFILALLTLFWINFKFQMMSEFEMSDMCLLHYFLGLEVYQVEEVNLVCLSVNLQLHP